MQLAGCVGLVGLEVMCDGDELWGSGAAAAAVATGSVVVPRTRAPRICTCRNLYDANMHSPHDTTHTQGVATFNISPLPLDEGVAVRGGSPV